MAAKLAQHGQHAASFQGADHPLLGAAVLRSVQRCLPPCLRCETPDALGLPGREAWNEIWDSMLHELLAGVVRTGEAFWAKDLLFEVERYGFPEETYFDVSYDPVRVESGEVGGVYCIVTETTERVVGGRRMAVLKDLAERNATARTAREACVLAMETLAAKPQDVGFALTYLDDQLQSCTPGAQEQLAACPRELVRDLSISSHSRPAGRRPQSAPPVRRTVPRVSRSRGRPAWHGAHQRARLRAGEKARRSARGARSRKDDVLQQRQSRVPHAAHPAGRTARRRAWRMRPRRCRPSIASGWRSRIAMPCGCCGS